MKFTASKKIIALVAAAAMLTGVAACGSSSNSSSSGVTEGGKTEITVWSWDSTLPRTVKDFEKANPDITVKVTNAGTNSTEYTALNNALSAGKGAPDLVQIEYYALPEYQVRGEIEDLSQFGADKFSDFYTPGTWASVKLNGGVYALPMDSGPMAWFYNKDVFDKAGVDPTRVRTWDEFYDAAKKVRATGSYITSDSGDAGFFDSMTWLAGATPFSTGSDGNAHEYFGGQKFNEELAKAAANVSTGYKFLPFEVYARGVYSDDAGGAYTDKSVTLAEGVQAWEKNIKDYASQQGYTVK